MSATTVLLLGDAQRWLRVDDGAVVARGEGEVVAEPGDAVVAVVPAADVTIGRAEFVGLAEPQARAAARLIVADQAIAPIDSLHVALGKPTLDANRLIASIDSNRMANWLAELARQGVDPDAVVPAPMLLPEPEHGFVSGAIGDEMLIRGRDIAFADDPALTAAIAGADVMPLDRATLEASVINAVADPDIDLRQGAFARKRQWGIDRAWLRRIVILVVAAIAVTILIQIVEIIRLNTATNQIERDNRALASAALPPGTTINAPLIQLREGLAALRGPGGGLLPLAGGVTAAVNASPNVELSSMIFDGGGTLRVTVRAQSAADLAAFDSRLTASGFAAAPGPIVTDQGRQVRDYTVSAK